MRVKAERGHEPPERNGSTNFLLDNDSPKPRVHRARCFIGKMSDKIYCPLMSDAGIADQEQAGLFGS